MAKRRGRGEGGVVQLPSGSWRVTLSLGVDRDGNRIRESITRETKAEAMTEARRRLAEVGPAASAERGLTVGQWVTRWLKDCEGQVTTGTYQVRAGRCRRSILSTPIASVPLSRLRPQDVRDWLAGLDRTPGERHETLRTLRAAIAEAVRREVVVSNAACKVRSRRAGKPDKRAMTAQQSRLLVGAAFHQQSHDRHTGRVQNPGCKILGL